MVSDERPLVSQQRGREMLGGIGKTKLWQLIRDGHLATRKLGRLTLIETASINAFIAGLPRRGGTPAAALRARAERRTAREPAALKEPTRM